VPSYSSNTGKGSNLATGAIVGIVMGIVAVAGAFLGLAILMRKRIMKRKRIAAALGNKPDRPFLDAELDDMGDSGPAPVCLVHICSTSC
jgi:hypothetical protein